MFAWWCSLLAVVLVTGPTLAPVPNRQGGGEAGYVAGGDAAGGRQGRPITVVGGTQAAGGVSSQGGPGTPGLGLNLVGDRQATRDSGTGSFGQGGGAAGSLGVNLGGGDGRFGSTGSVVDGGRFGSGLGTTGPAVDSGRFGPGGLRGLGGGAAAAAAQGGGRFGGGDQGARVVEAQDTPTVTHTVTKDFFVTLTDTALNTIPVTLTDFTVTNKIVETVQVARTPVDDRVALRTEVIVSPRTLTVTNVKSYYRIQTEVPVTTVTITHSSYIIMQSTYTTTATQVVTYTSTTVHTIVRTHRQDRAVYHTITNTAVVPAYQYYPY